MAQRLATSAEVLALAPELCEEVPELVATIVDVTGCMINLECWGTVASKAHTLLAAHFATATASESAPGGVVTARKIDKIGENYSVAPPTDAEISTTRYGRLYLSLRKTLVVAPIVGRACY